MILTQTNIRYYLSLLFQFIINISFISIGSVIKKRIIVKPKKIYKINDIITLKLIGDETKIFIKKKEFIQCKYLLLTIQKEDIQTYEKIKNIDELIPFLDTSMEFSDRQIDPETEFLGHCSNIQAFFDNDMNTDILHSNIAFPLLKKLVDVGYKPAEFKLKEEIARRWNEGNNITKLYLFNEEYFKYLNNEEQEVLIGFKIIKKQMYG